MRSGVDCSGSMREASLRSRVQARWFMTTNAIIMKDMRRRERASKRERASERTRESERGREGGRGRESEREREREREGEGEGARESESERERERQRRKRMRERERQRQRRNLRMRESDAIDDDDDDDDARDARTISRSPRTPWTRQPCPRSVWPGSTTPPEARIFHQDHHHRHTNNSDCRTGFDSRLLLAW